MSEQNEIERRRDEIMARLTTERDAAREHAQTYAEENRALRDNLRGAVERAEKAEAEVERLKRDLAATEAELRYAAGLDDDGPAGGQ